MDITEVLVQIPKLSTSELDRCVRKIARISARNLVIAGYRLYFLYPNLGESLVTVENDNGKHH